MATINAIWLLDDSPFRSADRVPFLKDPAVEAQARDGEEDRSNEEEGAESAKSRELSQQIDSHLVVLNKDQPRAGTTALDQSTQPPITTVPLLENPLTRPVAPAPVPLANATLGA